VVKCHITKFMLSFKFKEKVHSNMRQICILTDFTGTINVINKLSHLWWVSSNPVFNRSSVLKAQYDYLFLVDYCINNEII